MRFVCLRFFLCYFRFVNTTNISNAVSGLMQFNDCVTIPGFGAFVVNPSSAQLDRVKNKFTPPGKRVSFNKNITNNDGLLANAIAESEGISFEDAVHYINSFVEQANSELKSKNIFDFNSVGSFYRTEGNLLKFEPRTLESVASFGLESFHLTPLSTEEIVGKTKVVEHPATVATEIRYVKSSGTFGKIGWGLALVPFIAYLVWVPAQIGLLDNNRNFQFSNLNPFKSVPCEEYVSRPAGLSDIDLEVKEFLYSDFKESDFKFSVPETTNVVTPKPKVNNKLVKFQIIGGCFGEKSNASRLVSKLQDQGYAAKIFDKKSGLFRVSYGGFATQWEARKALRKVKANANASAWLYKMK